MSPGMMSEYVDSTSFFTDDGVFNAWSFAVELEERYRELNHPFVTTEESDHIYGHDGFTFYPNGAHQIEKEVRGTFGDAVSERDVNEVKRSVRVLTRMPYREAFDLNPEKVVVENGMVNLETGEFTPAAELNAPATLTQVPVEYDPEAQAPEINEFVHDLVPKETVPEIYELVGYCLYREYDYQKAFMLLGSGSNGKTTLLKLIERFLGKENVTSVALQDFANDKFKTAKLPGQLANIAGDLSSSKLYNTGVLKKLTGGDTIDAQRKYEDSFEFENHATMIFAANELPETEDKTDAFYRRWKLFDFPNQFLDEDEREDQTELLERLEEEFPGLLNAAIGGFQRLQERGGFKMPHDLADMQEEYERRSNSVKAWIAEQVSKADSDQFIRKKQAHKQYRDWCESNSLSSKSYKTFKDDVEDELGPEEGKDPEDGRRYVWIGLQVDGDAKMAESGEEGQQGRLTSVSADGGGENPQNVTVATIREAVEVLTADDSSTTTQEIVDAVEPEIRKAKAEHYIGKMLESGELYEPADEPGRLRLS